ncbi:hypothetical protein [Cognatishimia sp. MH4019]|uniref:hypothetical protein n=1 Tax=Cognatishimia sp. MH4019 TaxID=2854030 RepID=UPI001CD34521|nr:hypothetical protein [Cognatishimia sp. MH4019]
MSISLRNCQKVSFRKLVKSYASYHRLHCCADINRFECSAHTIGSYSTASDRFFSQQNTVVAEHTTVHFACGANNTTACAAAAIPLATTGGLGDEAFAAFKGAPNSAVKPITVSTDVKTWNQFQSATKGQFVSRADAAKGWDLYKQANGVQTGTVRSQAAKSFFLKQLGASGKAPKWMNQYLSNGIVPPGYHVDHLTPISVGGADSPLNMRLKDIATHVTRHTYYRPWE